MACLSETQSIISAGPAMRRSFVRVGVARWRKVTRGRCNASYPGSNPGLASDPKDRLNWRPLSYQPVLGPSWLQLPCPYADRLARIERVPISVTSVQLLNQCTYRKFDKTPVPSLRTRPVPPKFSPLRGKIVAM